MNKKVVPFRKKDKDSGGDEKMEVVLNREDAKRPILKSKSTTIINKLKPKSYINATKDNCNKFLFADLYADGEDLKDALGLSDEDVYDLLKK